MAAETSCGMHLLGAMDTLWFQNSLFLFPKSSESSTCSSQNSSQISLISEQDSCQVASVQDESSSQESDDDKERPTRLHIVPSKTRCHSSSPVSAPKQSRRLQKTMSCKSLWELELEEVKGFMDLGFIFQKENLNKRLIKLIPGLQRIDAYETTQKNSQDIFEDEEKKGVIRRPYLSEAWLAKRPDFPLLNLNISRGSTSDDMKKHLKNWARTVASTIHQESISVP